MKYMITAALALSLLGGTAMAQDHDRGRDGGERRGGGEFRGGQRPDGQGGGFRGGPQGQPQAAAPQAPAPQAAPPAQAPRFEGRGGQGFQQGQGFQGRQDFNGGDRRGGERGPDQRGDRRDDFRGGDRRGFERGPDARRDDRRDDFRGGDRRGFERGPDVRRGPEPGFRPGGWLRDNGWRGAERRFRGPSYRYPRGFGYQRWTFGAFLPFAFLASDYTLWDYWTVGLPAPPPGYHWIRVGPDALLVRYGDGYVLDAVYDLFY